MKNCLSLTHDMPPQDKVVLSGTPRANCVYSLDGYVVTGELNASVEEKESLAQVESLRGKRSFLSIVDDIPGVYEFIFSGSNIRHLKVQIVETLCTKSGIARHLIVIEMPQQNGLAEHMNRTLMDK
ncbi:retrovirus-related pol polyprotein from transposon TNT 1-94, partial [Tanacetum coccineum]